VPVTVAVNCCVWPAPSDSVAGLTVTVTTGLWVTVTVATAFELGLASEVATTWKTPAV
jgi:hypothetical protein